MSNDKNNVSGALLDSIVAETNDKQEQEKELTVIVKDNQPTRDSVVLPADRLGGEEGANSSESSLPSFVADQNKDAKFSKVSKIWTGHLIVTGKQQSPEWVDYPLR